MTAIELPPFVRQDGRDKVTGSARYSADMSLTGMLHGAFRFATVSHARILRIDTTKAKALPGVVAVITAADVPDHRYGGFVQDRTLFATDRVRWEGEPIAAVAATTAAIAKQAAALIEVDLEPLEAIDELAVLLGEWTKVVDIAHQRAASASDAEAAELLRRAARTRAEMLDDREGAVEDYEKSLSIEPDSRESLERLSALLEEAMEGSVDQERVDEERADVARRERAQRLVELYTQRVELGDSSDADLRFELHSRAAKLHEAVLESPRVVLDRQTDKAKGDKLAELKAAGVEYEERMRELEKIEHPKPLAELLWATFDDFSKRHPWVSGDAVRPKSIARDMVERWSSFDEYVREYDLARAEGVLLRYLSDVVKTVEQTVPAQYKTDLLDDYWLFLRDEVRGVDSSLLDEWEERTTGKRLERSDRGTRPRSLAEDPKALLVRVRRELHRIVRALAAKDWQAASEALVEDERSAPKELEGAMAPYFAQHGQLLSHHEARTADKTTLRELGPGRWEAFQTLVDPAHENDWVLEAEVELRPEHDLDASLSLLRLRRLGES